MEEFFLWDVEIKKFNYGEESVIEKAFSPKEFKKMHPDCKIYNPRKMPIVKLKDGDLCFCGL